MIRLGVIGLRNIGKGHVRRAAEVNGCEVVAVADTDPQRLEVADRAGEAKGKGS